MESQGTASADFKDTSAEMAPSASAAPPAPADAPAPATYAQVASNERRPSMEMKSQPSAGTGGCQLCSFSKELLMWKSPVQSGVALLLVNCIFLFLKGYSSCLISLLNYVGMIAMGVGFVASLVMGHSSERHVEVVSKKQMEDTAVRLFNRVNSLATSARSVFLWQNRAVSLTITIVMFASSYLLALMPIWLAVLLGLNVAMSHKVLCAAYKQFVAPHTDKLLHQVKVAASKIPKGPDHAKAN